MSDLQRSFAKTHLGRLPPEPLQFDERDEDQDDLANLRPTSPNDSSSSASSASSTGTIVPSASRNLFERPKASTIKSRSAPLPWQDFFAQELYFPNPQQPGLIHHAYLTPPTTNGPLIVTHHGAGSSGLSFATFFSELTAVLPTAGILSLDARAHGSTTAPPDLALDLTLPTLAADLHFIVTSTATHLSWSKLPDILLLGHSLGGAVITEVAHTQLLGPSLICYGVLDVVEGSAMDALQSMDTYLSTRPRSFPSLPSGIEWHIRSRTIRNSTSARVSVPALLQQVPLTNSSSAPTSTPPLHEHESNPEQQTQHQTQVQTQTQYAWRTNLSTTKPFWESWFRNLSSKFLSSRGGKLLLLAGTDRLDKELMIGQMQGKYQLQVFPEAGHFLHEDLPGKTAAVVADFYRRNERGSLVLPPKVDELIRQGKVRGSGREV